MFIRTWTKRRPFLKPWWTDTGLGLRLQVEIRPPETPTAESVRCQPALCQWRQNGMYGLKSVRGKGEAPVLPCLLAISQRKYRELTKFSITPRKQVYFKFRLVLLKCQVHARGSPQLRDLSKSAPLVWGNVFLRKPI